MRRLNFFLGLLVLLFIYLASRLTPTLGAFGWALLVWVFAGVMAYPSRWLRRSHMNAFGHLLRLKVYMDLGFFCFLTCFTLLRDALLLPISWSYPQVMGVESALVTVGLTFAALFFGVWMARSGPRVKRIQIPISGLPESLQGYRIVQISDLHVGPTIGPRFVSKVVEKVNSLSPDLTVLTGDIVDGNVDDHLPTVNHLAKLEPAGQVLYVTGNHEYYWDGPRWIAEFEKLGLEVLQNSRRLIRHEDGEILVAGVLDPASKLAHPRLGPDLKKALGAARDTDVRILLAHQPDIAHEAAEAGFDLMLAGHTHAGQFFPFTLFIHRFQSFVKGLMPCGEMWVYVNQGTGYWGPPIRLGTVTEITLLELVARGEACAPRSLRPEKISPQSALR